MNANNADIFEFLVIVFAWRETPLMCLLLLISVLVTSISDVAYGCAYRLIL